MKIFTTEPLYADVNAMANRSVSVVPLRDMVVPSILIEHWLF